MKKRENGQSAVEFALVLPILLLIVCGILDFGWLFYNQLSVENCVFIIYIYNLYILYILIYIISIYTVQYKYKIEQRIKEYIKYFIIL